MAIDLGKLNALLDEELERLSDVRVLSQIRNLRIQPMPVMRAWDYGEPGDQYLCWIVLRDGKLGIAYCENGFGPRCPWGLISAEAHEPSEMSMGMDSGWFTSFLDAYFESWAPTTLNIWRVFEGNMNHNPQPISPELSWNEAWEKVEEYRKSGDPRMYNCHHSIEY